MRARCKNRIEARRDGTMLSCVVIRPSPGKSRRNPTGSCDFAHGLALSNKFQRSSSINPLISTALKFSRPRGIYLTDLTEVLNPCLPRPILGTDLFDSE